MIQKWKERKEMHLAVLVELGVYHKFEITLPPPGTLLGLTLSDKKEGVEIKAVADSSPIQAQIPERFHKDVLIASVKSDATGVVQPKTWKDLIAAITKANLGGTAAQSKTLELFLLPQIEKA